MNALAKTSVIVVGSGALGSACAAELARRGCAVTVIEGSPLAANASGIAAGMIAPAMEAALDPISAGQFSMLAAARDLWPAFADEIGPTGLIRCGAVLDATHDVLAQARSSLAAQRARTETIGGRLFTPEDWRLEPRLALAAMRKALLDRGGRVLSGTVRAVEAGAVWLEGLASPTEADVVVLACGYGGENLAPELRCLQPIKGQLLRFPEAEPTDGAILRGASGYLVPGQAGPVVGATMEEGVSDTLIDPEATQALLALAARLAPGLAALRAEPFAGVRAATPDGLPLIGRSAKEGVWLATGARRNGWLLAPLAARIIADQIGGYEDDGLGSAAFTPSRFAST